MSDVTDDKKCECGNDKHDALIVPKPSYSFWGWILVGIGISHPPTKIRFACDRCGEVFEEITDPKILKKHTYH